MVDTLLAMDDRGETKRWLPAVDMVDTLSDDLPV
jgi:hypothetical protein